MPIETIESRRLYRQIADQISRLIEAGEYKPGERLPPERLLAAQFSVSRPSVREALIALEVEGWVDIRGGTGVFVAERSDPHPEDKAPSSFSSRLGNLPPPGPLEVLYARDLIEQEVASLAAKHATPESISVMARALGDMVCCSAGDPKHLELDHQFHFSLAEATGNTALVHTVEILWVMRADPLYIRLQDHFHNEAVWQRAIIEHREILEAVKRGDAKAARAAMHRHLNNARRRYISNWQES
ncbi:FadR/GntR family transcriptional regulator [Propionivibrio soli]|uniref:FadR/GntR family transcriptional regulator n=1 Tax=Propionivibrio soli TaxID=2976531 RepID=UPI0021E73373|nr:FadR/GntR family transcriptional regulator [Propionivibrio soli]